MTRPTTPAATAVTRESGRFYESAGLMLGMSPGSFRSGGDREELRVAVDRCSLGAIPSGTTATYTEIATRIGAPRAVRAVAGACAANALEVAIPCHRVIRHDGALSGYRWGVERKRDRLMREARA